MKKIVLTVMLDYGMGPYLWLNRSGDFLGVGGNCCDATGPCGSHPMSAELHEAFKAWVTQFARFPLNEDASAIDACVNWDAFHARGIELARRLKAEVGDEYRVVYEKPYEDPGREIDERLEVQADGTLTVLRARVPSS